MSKFFKKLLTKKPQKSKEDTDFKKSKPVKEQLFFDRNYTIHNFSELDIEDPRVIGFRSHGNKVLMVLDVKLPIKFAFLNLTRKSPAKKKRTVKKSPTKTRRSPKKTRRHL